MFSVLNWQVAGTPTWLKPPNRRVNLAVYISIAVVLFVIATGFLYDRRHIKQLSGESSDDSSHSFFNFRLSGYGAPPDPLALPGWREDTTWVTSDPEIQLHHWLERISNNETGGEMEWTVNKTVLLLGDSVLRDWIWRLCDNHLHVNRNMIKLSEVEKREPNEKTHSWECVAPTSGLRLVNGFLYGMTNYSRYIPEPAFLSWEWPPGPWGIEDRIPTLIKQYTPYQPDMIVVNSGPWDFKFLFKRDIYEHNDGTDIEPGELHEYGERLRNCMRMLHTAFPKSKLIFLQLHPLDSYDIYPKWWWSKEMAPGHKPSVDLGAGQPNLTNIDKYLPNLFTRRRVSQLASTYRRVAAEENWDDLDYWKLWANSEPKEFFRALDAIHPSDSSIAVMLDWMFEKLWRWSVHGYVSLNSIYYQRIAY